MNIILARLNKNQGRASELQEELQRSANVEHVMPWFFRKGKFTLKVIGKRTQFAIDNNIYNLPYSAAIIYETCGTEIQLSYEEWQVLSRRYYSPDVHTGIERYWKTEGM